MKKERTREERERDYILLVLGRDSNKEYPRSGRNLALGLTGELGDTYTDSTVRAIIRELRTQGEPIVSNSRGYYLSDNVDELLEQSKRLQRRGAKIMSVARALRKTAELAAAPSLEI